MTNRPLRASFTGALRTGGRVSLAEKVSCTAKGCLPQQIVGLHSSALFCGQMVLSKLGTLVVFAGQTKPDVRHVASQQ